MARQEHRNMTGNSWLDGGAVSAPILKQAPKSMLEFYDPHHWEHFCGEDNPSKPPCTEGSLQRLRKHSDRFVAWAYVALIGCSACSDLARKAGRFDCLCRCGGINVLSVLLFWLSSKSASSQLAQ
jgi:hypothetical protein